MQAFRALGVRAADERLEVLAEEVRWTGPVGPVVVGRPLACGSCGSGSKLAVRDRVETGREVLIPTDDCGYVAIDLGGLETDPIEAGAAVRLVEDPLLVHGAFALEGQELLLPVRHAVREAAAERREAVLCHGWDCGRPAGQPARMSADSENSHQRWRRRPMWQPGRTPEVPVATAQLGSTSGGSASGELRRSAPEQRFGRPGTHKQRSSTRPAGHGRQPACGGTRAGGDIGARPAPAAVIALIHIVALPGDPDPPVVLPQFGTRAAARRIPVQRVLPLTDVTASPVHVAVEIILAVAIGEPHGRVAQV